MKKLLFSLSFLMILAASLNAGEIRMSPFSGENGLIQASWSPFQLGLLPEKYCNLVVNSADIYGIAIGVFLLEQESAVISAGVSCGLNKNYGIQCAASTLSSLNYGLNVGALACFADRNYGLQIGVFNMEAEGKDRRKEFKPGPAGMQIGVFNFGQGYQIGLLNYNPTAAISLLPIFNCSK